MMAAIKKTIARSFGATIAPAGSGGGVVIPLPALPLASNAKVMAFGHSFVGNTVQPAYNAANTSTNGHAGFYHTGKGLLSWLQAMDGRFNVEVIADIANPFYTPNSFYAQSGALQGRGGDGFVPIPADPIGKPGFLNRLSYVIARKPDICILDMGYNDIDQSLGTYSEIVGWFDLVIQSLVNAGIYVLPQTLSWVATWAAGDPRYTLLDQVNAWLVAQVGRPGVPYLANTLSLDGPASGVAATMFADGNLHPGNKLMGKRAEIILPSLRNMVSPGENRHLNPLSATNIFPFKGTPFGAAGTLQARTTGVVATGMKLGGSAGTSTYVGSKEDIVAGQSAKQVITVTPVNDAAAFHSVGYGTIAAPTLVSLGIVAGDWVECTTVVELDDWAGWDYQDVTGGGPVVVQANPTVTGGAWNNGCRVGARNKSVVVRFVMWFPPGFTFTTIRLDQMFVLRHLCTVAGTGVAKISPPVFEKVADPRPAWMLPQL